jgi:hypothetical protein
MNRASIFKTVTVRDVLRAVGVAVPNDPHKLIRCPLPGHDDATPSFRIYDGGFVCFGGCGKGGIADLVIALGKAHDRREAAQWLETIR